MEICGNLGKDASDFEGKKVEMSVGKGKRERAMVEHKVMRRGF